MGNQAANSDLERSTAQLVGTCETPIHNQDPTSNESFGPWMIATRRPRRITSSLTDPINNAPFPVQTSRFNPIHVTESDEGIDLSAGVNIPSAAPAHQTRKTLAYSATRQFSKKKRW
ncbi:hypothetical protein V6N13_063891 [Hibiscus sabdariffa]